jgi:hypothetical protein
MQNICKTKNTQKKIIYKKNRKPWVGIAGPVVGGYYWYLQTHLARPGPDPTLGLQGPTW